MLLSLRKTGLTSLFKEVRVFKDLLMGWDVQGGLGQEKTSLGFERQVLSQMFLTAVGPASRLAKKEEEERR